MGCRRYYTLLASLPPLPRFDRAERLPINRARLQQRLRLLEPDDALLVQQLAAFLRGEQHSRQRSDAEMVAAYQGLLPQLQDGTCRQLVEGAVTQRTIVVALRRRQLQRPPPEMGEAWGMGPYAETLRRNWEHPDFRLAAVFPWLPQARQLLREGASLQLEHLLTELAWQRVERQRPADPFHFESLLGYLFHWSLLERWLAYAAEAARARFDDLLAETLGDHDRQLS